MKNSEYQTLDTFFFTLKLKCKVKFIGYVNDQVRQISPYSLLAVCSGCVLNKNSALVHSPGYVNRGCILANHRTEERREDV